ncbi:DUF3467 domain-containing protein [Candidatus Aerophobetes bacterium]|nr:DUF3467 domain-containing protein [Candidatus Aerophobetes bacterium]
MPEQKKIGIKITDDVLAGVYANAMRVTHTQEEFLLDFMNVFPPQGIVTARIVISPGHLRRIVNALNDNLSKYEQKIGKKIEPIDEPQPGIGFTP